MPLAEGVQAVISIKQYVSGAIQPNVEDLAPPTAGAQQMRRVSSTLNLKKATYTSAEIRPDRQIADFRHGVRSVDGDIAGELSPGTYFDLMEAVHRDTAVAGATGDQGDFTGLAASASGSTFTFASGDPVAKGFRNGQIMRFTGNTSPLNDDKNFAITGFSGAGNDVVHVTPAPVDSTSSLLFTVNAAGRTTKVPSSGFVSRKYGIEIYHEDLDQSRLFTETRASKYALGLPATGMATFTASFMGRNMLQLSGAGAPYFAPGSLLPVTTTGILAAVNGMLLVNGIKAGVVTGLTLQCDLGATPAPVVGQDVTAEIFLGRANVTGQITAYLMDTTMFGDFINETEMELLVRLDTTSAVNTPSLSIYLPRLKLGGADLATSGEGGQMITAPFQALLYQGNTPGKPLTTIQIYDTEA